MNRSRSSGRYCCAACWISMPISCCGDLDAVGLADLRQQQAEAHAALGDAAVIVLLGLDLLERRRRDRPRLAISACELLPDLLELGLDHRSAALRNRGSAASWSSSWRFICVRVSPAVSCSSWPLSSSLSLSRLSRPSDLAKSSSTLLSPSTLTLLHGHVELGVLALEILGRVVGREGHLDGLVVARLGAGELLLEAGDEAARADHQRRAFGLAALEFDAVDAADEIDDQLVAVGGLLGLGRVGVALLVRRPAAAAPRRAPRRSPATVSRSSLSPSIEGASISGSTSTSTLSSASLPCS